MVLDLLSLGQVDRILTDVGGKVGHSLEIAADEQELERRIDGAGVGHHVREQDAEERVVERIHVIVGLADFAAQRAVGPNEGIECITQHTARAARHVLDFRVGNDGRTKREEPEGRLRDVYRVITDPLQIARDLDGADDEAEVASHGLLQRQQFDSQRLDLDFQQVDFAIALDYRIGLVLVAREQGVNGQIDQLFRAGRHFKQPLLERRELIVKVPKAS